MTKRKLTTLEKAQRMLRRDDRRQARAARAEANQVWFREREVVAEKRRIERREDREKRRRARRTKKTAAGRVPKAIRDVSTMLARKGVTWEQAETGVSVVDGRKVYGNHADRRAQGARGKPRALRSRELPGAEQRRIERNRKGWNQ